MPTSGGYELDFYAWLNQQAQVLRSRESESLDWDHLAEEIEAMAAGEKRELTSHLKTLLVHLLKLEVGIRQAQLQLEEFHRKRERRAQRSV